jgi:hypothetical protein
MYLILVSGLVQSSKRIVYPTSCPNLHPTSSATRFATDIAATRRGCVHPIRPLSAYPDSARYCTICVVFPEPVSPTTMRSRTSGGCPKSSAALGRVRRSVNRFLGFHVVVHLPFILGVSPVTCVRCNVNIVAMILPGRRNVRRVLLHDRMTGRTQENPETVPERRAPIQRTALYRHRYSIWRLLQASLEVLLGPELA